MKCINMQSFSSGFQLESTSPPHPLDLAETWCHHGGAMLSNPLVIGLETPSGASVSMGGGTIIPAGHGPWCNYVYYDTAD